MVIPVALEVITTVVKVVDSPSTFLMSKSPPNVNVTGSVVAVAAALSSNEVELPGVPVIEAIVAPSGIPVPLTGSPATIEALAT